MANEGTSDLQEKWVGVVKILRYGIWLAHSTLHHDPASLP